MVGLAPAAHGGNRTGRVFTGDKSADFLFKCLFKAKLSNQPNSDYRNDGLKLYNTYLTPALKCVPPGDKPTPTELRTCFIYLRDEFNLLSNVNTRRIDVFKMVLLLEEVKKILKNKKW